MKRILQLSMTITLVLGACDASETEEGDHGETGEEEGTPSGAACSADSTLTYANFGASFMDTYCTHCHSSELSGAARNGAPDGHDFDTLDGIVLVAEHIDEHAAAGPDSTNELMPPSGSMPTLAEREMLGEWLACEAPP